MRVFTASALIGFTNAKFTCRCEQVRNPVCLSDKLKEKFPVGSYHCGCSDKVETTASSQIEGIDASAAAKKRAAEVAVAEAEKSNKLVSAASSLSAAKTSDEVQAAVKALKKETKENAKKKSKVTRFAHGGVVFAWESKCRDIANLQTQHFFFVVNTQKKLTIDYRDIPCRRQQHNAPRSQRPGVDEGI